MTKDQKRDPGTKAPTVQLTEDQLEQAAGGATNVQHTIVSPSRRGVGTADRQTNAQAFALEDTRANASRRAAPTKVRALYGRFSAAVRSPIFLRTPGSGSRSKRAVRNLMIEVVSYVV